jgi:hypothetical protein
MSLQIQSWSRVELLTSGALLASSARALNRPALLPYIEAAEATQSILETTGAHSSVAEVVAAEASRDLEARQEEAMDRAQSLVLSLRILATEGVEGASALIELVNRAWPARDRKARGAASLIPLRALVAALTLAAPSAATAQIATALDRLNAATESLAQSQAQRSGEQRDRKEAQTDRQTADKAAREALTALRRAVALEVGGETSAAYLAWKAPVAARVRRSRREEQPAPAK